MGNEVHGGGPGAPTHPIPTTVDGCRVPIGHVTVTTANRASRTSDQMSGMPIIRPTAPPNGQRSANWPRSWAPPAIRPDQTSSGAGGPDGYRPGHRQWVAQPGPAAGVAEQPPEHLMPILAQLLTGATDVTASARLGMSPRTFSRRVSELLECLGVLSRFQAGVAAVNNGWVAPRGVRPTAPSGERTGPTTRPPGCVPTCVCGGACGSPATPMASSGQCDTPS